MWLRGFLGSAKALTSSTKRFPVATDLACEAFWSEGFAAFSLQRKEPLIPRNSPDGGVGANGAFLIRFAPNITLTQEPHATPRPTDFA